MVISPLSVAKWVRPYTHANKRAQQPYFSALTHPLNASRQTPRFGEETPPSASEPASTSEHVVVPSLTSHDFYHQEFIPFARALLTPKTLRSLTSQLADENKKRNFVGISFKPKRKIELLLKNAHAIPISAGIVQDAEAITIYTRFPEQLRTIKPERRAIFETIFQVGELKQLVDDRKLIDESNAQRAYKKLLSILPSFFSPAKYDELKKELDGLPPETFGRIQKIILQEGQPIILEGKKIEGSTEPIRKILTSVGILTPGDISFIRAARMNVGLLNEAAEGNKTHVQAAQMFQFIDNVPLEAESVMRPSYGSGRKAGFAIVLAVMPTEFQRALGRIPKKIQDMGLKLTEHGDALSEGITKFYLHAGQPFAIAIAGGPLRELEPKIIVTKAHLEHIANGLFERRNLMQPDVAAFKAMLDISTDEKELFVVRKTSIDPELAARNEEDLRRLIRVLPRRVQAVIETLLPEQRERIEDIAMDLGSPLCIASGEEKNHFEDVVIDEDDLREMGHGVAVIGQDNRIQYSSIGLKGRVGVEGTLNRISPDFDTDGTIHRFTARYQPVHDINLDPIKEYIKPGNGILICGSPGMGKTTILRKMARMSRHFKMLGFPIVIDPNGELGGTGRLLHPFIAGVRRFKVPPQRDQASVMLEAVQNHRAGAMFIDEIGTKEEAQVAANMAGKGITLYATTHAKNLSDLADSALLESIMGNAKAAAVKDETSKEDGGGKMRRSISNTKTAFQSALIMTARNQGIFYGDLKKALQAELDGRHAEAGGIKIHFDEC